MEKVRSSFIEKIFHFDLVDSTNTYAVNLEEFPENGIFVIYADSQTCGRGQRENRFYSGRGGLYASIVCPLPDISLHFNINRSLSIAICKAVEKKCPDMKLSIKWPNDIYCHDRKICGILLESMHRSKRHIAAGFGLNVNTYIDDFPDNIKKKAASLIDYSKTVIDLTSLLMDVCRCFEKNRNADPVMMHQKYLDRLYGKGRKINILGNTGVLETVLDDGRLCVDSEGKRIFFSSGSLEFIS
jgi:BirA family transcriptional regulator, biotin operon repressor / biotin---[acetyl-CoA-carboxylase] ligase